MDKGIQEKMDAIVADEIHRGFRIKGLPEDLVQLLDEAHGMDAVIPVFKKVRFMKLTPRKRRLTNEAVVRRYHTDLKNKEMLSTAELRKMNIERGEWSAEQEKELETLQAETNTMMRDLYLDGFDKRAEWLETMAAAAQTVRTEINESKEGELTQALSAAEKTEALTRFARWMDWSVERQAEFDTKYAAAQELPKYSPDRDLKWLLTHTPSVPVVDALNEIDDLKDKLRRYVILLEKRQKLMELQVKQAKLFAESVEQRRDTAEEVARMYYCTEVVNDADVGQGPITPTLDAAWDLPDEVVQWLLVEMYFFLNGIPDEAREFLATWGFTRAEPSAGLPESSAASPADQTPSSAGQPATPTPVVSSGSKAVTTLATSS